MHEYARTLVKFADDIMGYDRPNGTGVVPFVETGYHDDDLLSVSNFNVLLADLQAIDDRVRDTYAGYGRRIVIEVPLTDAICEACERADRFLADYPVLNDEDLSERESADLVETLTNCYDVPSTLVDDVVSELFEHHNVSRSDDVRADDVTTVVRQLLFTLASGRVMSEADTIRLATDLLDEIGLSVVLVDREHDASTALIREQLVNRGLRPLTVAGTPDDGVVVVLDFNDARSLLDD